MLYSQKPTRGSPPETAPSRSSSILGYQPSFDGIRGLALLTVVAAHLSIAFPWMGAFTSWFAVDLFFVLSGFLITTLMLREFGASNRISLRSFYVRRVGRLYPMIAAVLVISVVMRVAFADTGLAPTWFGITAIAAYFANWAVIINDNYRDLAGFSPTWSLALEEQFYLVWPIVLVSVLAITRRRAWLIGIVSTVALAIIMYRRHVWLGFLGYAASNPGAPDLAERANSTWLYLLNSTFTRPDGVLIGVLGGLIVGFRPTRPSRRVRLLIAAAGNIAFVCSIVFFAANPIDARPSFVFNWGLTAFNLCTMALLFHLLYNARSILAKMFEFRPLVWLGRRSYSIYILHLFIYQVGDHNGWDSIVQVWLQTAVIFFIAGLSYRYYEVPVRRWVISRFGGTARA